MLIFALPSISQAKKTAAPAQIVLNKLLNKSITMVPSSFVAGFDGGHRRITGTVPQSYTFPLSLYFRHYTPSHPTAIIEVQNTHTLAKGHSP